MPRKDNSRYKTLMKLFEIGKGDESSISKLQIEDLETITEDKDIQNIILLRRYIKEKNTLEYLKEDNKQTKKEERKGGNLMPNKYQLINTMTSETIKEITSNSKNWTDFLNTASNNYKYDFNEQVLIYAQKPDATACADIETWNKKLKRWVNKGAKGIALISLQDGRNILRYVFDISDTHSGINKELKLWEVNESHHNGIIETLENSFGKLVIKENLAEAIYSATQNLVEDNYNDYLKDLKDVLKNSYLENIKENEIDGNFILLLTNSITYIVMKRCGLDPNEFFSDQNFDLISFFNTKQVTARLGGAISDIAEQELREIYSTVINIEKSIRNKNYTFVKKNNNEYDISKEKIERRIENYDRSNIQTNGRLSDTRNSITTGEEITTRQVFKNEVDISKGTQKRTIRGINDGWKNGRTFRRNRNDSKKEDKTNNSTISREIPSERRNEIKQSNGMGRANELNKESSRRNSNAGTNFQLNLFSDNYVPPIKELPSIDKQIETIENQVEVENTSTFSFTQESVDFALQNGTGNENGKYRVYRLYQETLSKKERIDFLKSEFGYYGTNGVKKLEGIWVEYTPSKGLKLTNSKDTEKSMIVNWSSIEKRIGELIKFDRYFDNNEKIEYQNWIENEYDNEKWMFNKIFKEDIADNEDFIPNIEKNYKLSDGSYFHFHTNDEGYYYAIYDNNGIEQDGGLLEYSKNEKNQSLNDIRKRLSDFTDISELSNENMEEVSQEFIDNLENNEILNEEINFKIGQFIYLESDRKYRVEAINKDLDKIILLDQTMLESSHYPITREESYIRAVNLYKNNDRNFIKEETKGNELLEDKPIIQQEKINYQITNNALGEGTPKEKVKRNIDAIKTLKKIEDEKRLANKEEQEILSQYIGWGGLPDVFDENKENWSSEYKELKEILTPEEYSSARASTLTAFYTPPVVIKAMYKVLQNMGAEQVNMLEPSCRSWKFFRYATRRNAKLENLWCRT